MSNSKPTDSEIVKALECCKYEYDTKCELCCYNFYSRTGCRSELRRNALDLINRLQAENERLQGSVDRYNIQVTNQREQIEKYEPIKETLCVLWETMSCIGVAKGKEKPTLEELAEAVDHIKTEAYKKCVEKVKEIMRKYCGEITEDDLDNILKEMVGEDNA